MPSPVLFFFNGLEMGDTEADGELHKIVQIKVARFGIPVE